MDVEKDNKSNEENLVEIRKSARLKLIAEMKIKKRIDDEKLELTYMKKESIRNKSTNSTASGIRDRFKRIAKREATAVKKESSNSTASGITNRFKRVAKRKVKVLKNESSNSAASEIRNRFKRIAKREATVLKNESSNSAASRIRNRFKRIAKREATNLKNESSNYTSFQSKTRRASLSSRVLRGSVKLQPISNLYTYGVHVRENHKMPIYGIKFNNFLPKEQAIFATVGSNRVSIYECVLNRSNSILLKQVYVDPNEKELFYTCVWSYKYDTRKPLLIAAGLMGIIRVIDPTMHQCIQHYIGHTHAINELAIHPINAQLLLSCSKDYSIRLWNIATHVCVLIMAGMDGHRDEVLSIDFNSTGNWVVSGGFDHSIKIWCLDKEETKTTILNSFIERNGKFRTRREYFPDYTTRNIHSSYVDCVRCIGNLILSKASEKSIVAWKPGLTYDENLKLSRSNTLIVQNLFYEGMDIWYIRFDFCLANKVLALGNQNGNVYVWKLVDEDLQINKSYILTHSRCKSAIRQTAFSKTGNILICVCDDATVWRWNYNAS